MDHTDQPNQRSRSHVGPAVPVALAHIVRAGVRANREVPGAVALGGTVCAMYANHRLSIDIDFVVSDLRDRFEKVREHMLGVPGWAEANANPPVLLLGSIDGVDVGFRQLRRTMPLDTLTLQTPDGPLTIPTLHELIRTKAFLLYQRTYTRDHVDFAMLSLLLPDDEVVTTLADLDKKFAWDKQPSVLLGTLKALIRAAPVDLETHGFETFRWLSPGLTSWNAVHDRCQAIGRLLSVHLGAQLP